MGPQQATAFLKDIAERTAADWLVGIAGVGVALVSASFAAYMISVGPRDPNPKISGNFNVFAQFDHRVRAAASAGDPMSDPLVGPMANPRPVAALQPSPSQPSIDFAPTGSIAPGAGTTVQPGRMPHGTGTLEDFVLRDVFDGKALVEGRHRLSLVSPGSVLEGAGAVLSIEQQSGAWVIVTDEGVIRARTAQ